MDGLGAASAALGDAAVAALPGEAGEEVGVGVPMLLVPYLNGDRWVPLGELGKSPKNPWGPMLTAVCLLTPTA